MLNLAELAPLPVAWWPSVRPWIRGFCWLLAVAFVGQRLHHAWNEFDTHKNTDPLKHRPVPNDGHRQIDFGGQWVMGRLIVLGHGRKLYHRQVQWEVVRASFPPELEPPIVAQQRFPVRFKDAEYQSETIWTDAEWMMYWFMGADAKEWSNAGKAVGTSFLIDPVQANPLAAVALAQLSASELTPAVQEAISKPAIGGPLYPPVHALLYAPLGLFESPATAYRVFQVLCVLAAILGGVCIWALSSGHIWMSIAISVLVMYPGYRPGIDLGQNPMFSLAILLGGVALAVRGRPTLGGLVWALLAFKPVWAVTFLLLPLLLREWRFAFAMMTGGALSILVTLPVVGVQSWFDWLQVGKDATNLYNVNETWNSLSRDLHGLVRRVMIDYTLPEQDRLAPVIAVFGWPMSLVSLLCWSLWGTVFSATVGITFFKNNRHWISPVTAFAMLGLFLCSYRFMYYDVLLSAAGLAVLTAYYQQQGRATAFDLRGPRRATLTLAALPYSFIALLLINENWLIATGFEFTGRFEHFSFTTTDTAGATGKHTPVLLVVTNVYYPIDTLIVLTLWTILAIKIVLQPREAVATPGQYPASA